MPSDRLGEYDVKAAFIYNFARFIEWTPWHKNGENPFFSIGVLGEEPFGNALDDTFTDKTIAGSHVRIMRAGNLQALMDCQILFISQSEQSRVDKILNALNDRQILTIADFPGFAEAGGIIELRVEENRVRFLINQKTAVDAGLKISSKLLNLAQKVITR